MIISNYHKFLDFVYHRFRDNLLIVTISRKNIKHRKNKILPKSVNDELWSSCILVLDFKRLNDFLLAPNIRILSYKVAGSNRVVFSILFVFTSSKKTDCFERMCVEELPFILSLNSVSNDSFVLLRRVEAQQI